MTEHNPNQLIHETSPYLLQHATNPVNWHPWGEQAFREAKDRDVPVFLSIGYATCHWCHVMEEESFEDPGVAEVLNLNYVCIKVDREERPDIDGQYMKVCQLMTGSGGWPLTVVLTPDKRPFFAATYIPRTSRHGRSGLMELLPRITELWENNRQALLQPTDRLLNVLNRDTDNRTHTPIDPDIMERAFRELDRLFDPVHGGFGESPKFPTVHHLNFLIRFSIQFNNKPAQHMALRTLDMMALGGIHDHVGGGFHRYSTDSRWQVPHFEKMLYDQALLIMPYLAAYQLSGKTRYLRTVNRIVDYVQEILTDRFGRFMSAEDADSDGKEGAFYVWSAEELRNVLGPDMAFLNSLCPVRENGNYHDPIHENESGNIIYIDETSLEKTRETTSEKDLYRQLDNVLDQLKTYRDTRQRPAVDYKVQTDWNGMMIAALASIFTAVEDQRSLDMATVAMDQILSCEKQLGILPHICREETPVIPGFLDDYAWLVQGLLNLYQATFAPCWLDHANRLGRILVEQFEDQGRGFSFTSDRHERILFDPSDTLDGAIPSGNAVAWSAVSRLAGLTGESHWSDVASRIAEAHSGKIRKQPAGHTGMLTTAMHRMAHTSTLTVVCNDPSIARKTLLPLRRRFFHGLDILLRTPQSADLLDRLAPHTRDMAMADEPVFYLCSGTSCQAPVSDVEEIMNTLERTTGYL